MKFWLLVILLLLIGYGILMAYAWRGSDARLFHPGYGSMRKPAGFVRIPADGHETCAALYLPNPQAKHLLWYFHGNAEDLGDLELRLKAFHEKGYAVFAVEYPGYGLNSGQPSEEGFYGTTRWGFRYLVSHLNIQPERMIAYGRSIGGAPAVELASRETIGGLILESAFTSAFRVVTGIKILPFDKFDNLAKIDSVKCPTLVMHGEDDRIVPFSHGAKLFEAAPDPKQHFWIPTAGHNDVMDGAGPAYWQTLDRFTQTLD